MMRETSFLLMLLLMLNLLLFSCKSGDSKKGSAQRTCEDCEKIQGSSVCVADGIRANACEAICMAEVILCYAPCPCAELQN